MRVEDVVKLFSTSLRRNRRTSTGDISFEMEHRRLRLQTKSEQKQIVHAAPPSRSSSHFEKL